MSSDEIYQSPRKASFRVYMAVLSAQMGSASVGCTLGWSGPALEGMTRNDSRPHLTDSLKDQSIKSWIGSSMALSAVFRGIMTVYLIDYLGRKKTLILLGILFSIGWILLGLGKVSWVIILGRSITGLCTGILVGVLPLYVTEISTPNIRGRLGMAFNLFRVLGVIYIGILNLWLPWNYATLGAIAPSMLLSVLMLFMPESPNWLMSKLGRDQRVTEALRVLRDPTSDVEGELDELEKKILMKKEVSQSISLNIIMRQDFYKAMSISVALVFFQQFCGINAIQFYMNSIFAESGTTLKPNTAVIIVNVICLLATFLAGVLIDRLGRKLLLLLSGGGQTIACVLFIYYYYDMDSERSLIPIISVTIFIASWSMAWLPVVLIMITEISSRDLVGLISSLSSAICWLFCFIVTKEFSDLVLVLHKWGVFCLFCAISLFSILFVFSLPETKGKTLDEIHRLMYPKMYRNEIK